MKISHFDTCVLTKKYPLKSEEQRIANARVLKNFLCGDPLIRRENVRCKVKGKIFAAILNKRQKGVRCKVKGVL